MRRIDIDEDGGVTVYTKDGNEMRCKSWQIIDIGGHPFLLLEEPWIPIWTDNLEEVLALQKSKH